MAKGNIVRWITVKGRRVPIYEDGSMGGFMEGKQESSKEVSSKQSKAAELARRQLIFDKPGNAAEIASDNWRKIVGVSNERMAEIMSEQDPKYEYEASSEKDGNYIHHYMHRIPKEGGKKKETTFGKEFQESADKYREKFLTKRTDEEIADIKKNLDKSAAIVGTTHDDDIAYKAIRDEQERRKKGSKSLEDHSDIQKIAEEHVKKIWNGGAANRELYDAAEKWAEEHNFDKTKAKDAAFAAMNKKQMAEIKRRENEKSIKVGDKEVAVNKTASTYQEREVKRLVGDKYGEAWAARRIDSYSSSKLKQIAKDAGIKNISTVTDNELRKKLLAMWKRG